MILEPQGGFWDGRIYRDLDREGYQWEFSQRVRELAAQLWELPPGIKCGGEE